MVSLSLDSEELARNYDVVGERQYSHGKLLIGDLAIRQGAHVLDVGSGTGLLGVYVAEQVGPDGRVVGIDPLPLRVELANKKRAARFESRVGIAEDLSAFEPASFDIVYLNSVIHWIQDKKKVLEEIRRVLKPSGRLGFTTATTDKPHSFDRLRAEALASVGLRDEPRAGVGIPYRVSLEQVRSLFREAGFHERQVLLRTFVDHFASVDDLLAFNSASSFGNHFSALTDSERQKVRAALEKLLEAHRDGDGIRQERHLIFAVAEKPALS